MIHCSLSAALWDRCRRPIIDLRADRVPPELSAVLKHEPERRSGAAQPALLVRLQGKTVPKPLGSNFLNAQPGRAEHGPRGGCVDLKATLVLFAGSRSRPRGEACGAFGGVSALSNDSRTFGRQI